MTPVKIYLQNQQVVEGKWIGINLGDGRSVADVVVEYEVNDRVLYPTVTYIPTNAIRAIELVQEEGNDA